jgi:hypothetical protein
MRRHQFAPAAEATREGPSSRAPVVRPGVVPPSVLGTQLQRAYGNRDVQRVLARVRSTPTLEVGPAGDRFDREADRVAEQVAEALPPDRPADGGFVDSGVRQAIQRERGRGQALPEDVRTPMEQALGADFSRVRLHTDARADQLNRGLQARAFTTGHDVFLRRGEADLSSRAGRALIAHELTHVVQQDGGQPVIQRKLLPVGGNPDILKDSKTGTTAVRKVGAPGIWEAAFGLEYVIQLDQTGEETFVLNLPPPPPTQVPTPTPPPPPTLVPQSTPIPQSTPTPPPVPQTTLTPTPPPQTTPTIPTTVPTTAPTAQTAQTAFQLPPPIQLPTQVPSVWNPGPRSTLWDSPGGKTGYSFSPRGTPYDRGPKGGPQKDKTRREATVGKNPGQFDKNMLPLWERAALSPIPTGLSDTEKRKHFQDPDRRFEVSSPKKTRKKTIKHYKDTTSGRSKVVLGHEPSAGTYVNTVGHTLPRSQNLVHNKSTGAYHGLEDATWSSASGASEPRYLSPRPDRGSHPTFYDPTSQGFTGGPWPTYTPVPTTSLVDRIEARLTAAASTAGTDPEYLLAVDELAKLKTAYSQAAAQDLLSVIRKRGW